MLVVEEKRKSNVVEYVILMYQIEDLIRAYNFSITEIKQKLIIPQTPSESLIPSVELWYKTIIDEMMSQKIERKGHLSRIQEVIMELIYVHNTLLNMLKDPKYIELVERATSTIEEFRKKSDLGEIHPVEVALQAMYMKLLLRLQRKEISAETEDAFDSMRILLAYLSKSYKDLYEGKLGSSDQ